jgi:hypothetical protein
MRYSILFVALVLACALFGVGGWKAAHAEGVAPFVYVSPRPGAKLVSPATTIVIRHGEVIERESLSEMLFHVEATRSGVHFGQVTVADDDRTVVFTPYRQFEPDETVTVTIEAGLATVSHRVLDGIRFKFSTWADDPGDIPDGADFAMPSASTAQSYGARETLPHSADRYATLPPDFPIITVTAPTTNTNGGYFFLSNLSDNQAYLLMLETSGEPVYYQRIVPSRKTLDFKRQPNGLITYFDSLPGVFYGLDSSYTNVRTYAAGNGYRADHHDLQVLANGHYLVLIWDAHVVDMSKIVPGGQSRAYVIGLIVQELDTANHVVFEWRSWDHIQITETTEDLTAQRINYTHGNAIEADYDGNILISARNLDQVIKIDRQTGDIIWRLGGQKNEFTLRDDDQFFHRQHDIRRLPNGNITLFDNRTDLTPYYSRAVEYRLDETARTVTRVWEYRNTPDVYAPYLANVQRLPNGNTLVGWGLEWPAATEVRPDGTKEFEFSFVSTGEGSYRVFRFPWVGRPSWPPVLALKESAGRVILSFSWNGATEIGSYRVLGGATTQPNSIITMKERTGFETSLDVTEASASFCSFQVMPVDRDGHDTAYSNVVFLPRCFPYSSYLPLVFRK